LRTISFKRQYPKWLYPGSSDIEPMSAGQQEPGVEYLLDAMSPLSWRRAAVLILESGSRHVVFNWWTLFWAPAFALMARWLRRRRIGVVFLCHNLSDHGTGGIKSWLARRMLSQADAYITHSSEQTRALRALHPDKPVLQRLLPIFDQFPAPDFHLSKRGRLELLFFGFIRPYKGLKVLLDAVSMLDDPQVFLTVVGESWESTADIDAARERLGDNLETHLAYVDDDAAAKYFDRADVVILPYLSATGSGVAALAYHYGKPVLASRVGGLQDAVVPGQTGWLAPPGSAKALADVLSGIDRASAHGLQAGIAAFVNENSWDAMATSIREFLSQLPATTGNCGTWETH
jgi:glycosyltransferase involved in cell wall biosynthesis